MKGKECGKKLRDDWLVQKQVKLGDVEGEWKIFKNSLLLCGENERGMKRLRDKGIRRGSEWWNRESAIAEKTLFYQL